MYKLKLHDRNGEPLSEGDIVRISNGKSFAFYSEVKYLEKEQSIAPFCTFSFHSFVKVNQVPRQAIRMKEERYECWFLPDAEADNPEEAANSYLIEWRECEHLLNGYFTIEK